MCLVDRKMLCSVLCTMYGVLCIFRDASYHWCLTQFFFIFYYCSLCSEHNKASDAETVSTDCRHLKQFLCSNSLSLPSSRFNGNFISCFVSCYLSGGSKLDNKSPDLCWSRLRKVKTTTGLNRPVAISGVPRNFFRGGVQQIQLRTEDREDGDLGAVAP